MKSIFLAIAVWNTVVALINVFVLPIFTAAETLKYVTATSQILPVIIPLLLWVVIVFKKPICRFWEEVAYGHAGEFGLW